jgi:hypothetical protein
LLALAGATGPKTNDGLSWHWERDTPTCSLFQQTPDGNKVYISRTPGEDETRIGFRVFSTKFWKGLYEGGSVALSTGVTAPATIQVYTTDERDYDLDASVKEESFFSALANSSNITVGHDKFGKFTVSVGDLGPAVAALTSCEDSKLRDWGIDVKSYRALASRPHAIGSLPDLFDSTVYPSLALSRSVERNVITKLDIGADGSVTSCGAPGHFAYPQFVDSVCKVLKSGARFTPARDATGAAVAAPYVLIVSFRVGAY